MRKVDWPDEEGYWWAVQQYDAPYPMRFKLDPHEGISQVMGTYIPVGITHYEGPIPQPKAPMRFEINGKVTIVRGTHCGSILISPSVIPYPADGKRFKITFEEILC